ncbi:MAG: nucleotidyltransferase family protein, partial [Solobacterium sp.]|nr:nucleotidyltransferase family protein [Solobacterium sp.]
MERIEERFLDAYRCAVNGRSTAWEETDASVWRQLFTIAGKHAVLPMIYEAVREDPAFLNLKETYRNRMQDRATNITLSQAQFSARFLHLYQYLNRTDLYHIVMKGIIFRNLYPHTEQRVSTDEDLLIPEELYAQYHKALVEYGLTPVTADTELSEVSYESDGLYIVLHKKPFPPEAGAYGDLNRFFTGVESRKTAEKIYGVSVYTMGPTDHLLYLITHVYKHFLNAGTGIRQVSDIVLYSIKNLDWIDWELILDQCREIGILEFTGSLYRIGEKYICDHFPGKLTELWKTEQCDETELLADILEGGLYGTSSEDRLHSSNITLRTMEAAKAGRSGSLAGTLFPPYSYMKQKYAYVEKLPGLLPVGCLHRLISYGTDSILHRRKGNDAMEAMRIGQERVELMRRYGILEESQKQESALKRLYDKSHTSVFAPVLSPLYMFISMLEYHVLNLVWQIQGNKRPTKEEQEAVKENVTFIA